MTAAAKETKENEGSGDLGNSGRQIHRRWSEMAFRKPLQKLNWDWGTPQKVCFRCASGLEPTKLRLANWLLSDPKG